MRKRRSRFTLDIRELYIAAVAEKGGNISEGQEFLIDTLEDDFTDGVIDLQSFDVKEAFHAFCDPDRYFDRGSSVDDIAEAIQGSQFPRFMYTVLVPVIVKAYDSALENALMLVTQENTIEETVNVPGLGEFYGPEHVPPGTEYGEDSAEEFNVTIKMHKYGFIVPLTREAILADKPSLLTTRARNAGRKMGTLVHEFIVKKITNVTTVTWNKEGVNTAYVYNGTGYAHISDDHSTIDGQTNDNISTTAFGHSGIKALRTLLRLMKDDRGRPMPVTPRVLMVPDTIYTDAEQLLGSDHEVGNANNEINPFKGKYKLWSSPFLDDNSTTQYYLGDPAIQTYLFWRMRPTTTVQGKNSEAAFKKDVVSQYKYAAEFNVGMLDYRYIGRGGT